MFGLYHKGVKPIWFVLLLGFPMKLMLNCLNHACNDRQTLAQVLITLLTSRPSQHNRSFEEKAKWIRTWSRQSHHDANSKASTKNWELITQFHIYCLPYCQLNTHLLESEFEASDKKNHATFKESIGWQQINRTSEITIPMLRPRFVTKMKMAETTDPL